MKTRYAQNNFSPSLARPVHQAGFGAERRVKTTHNDLNVRALDIQNEQTTGRPVALDLLGFFPWDV